MAADEEKSIGKLTIDITDVQKKIKEVNGFLQQIGANVNIENVLTDKIDKAVKRLVNEAKKAGSAAKEAIESAGNANIGNAESQIDRLSKKVTTLATSADSAMGQVIKSVSTGFDSAGNKIREFANAEGEITKRTVEIKGVIERVVQAYQMLYSARGKMATLDAQGKQSSVEYTKAINNEKEALAVLRPYLADIKKLKEAQDNNKKVSDEVKARAKEADEIIRAAKATIEYKNANDELNASRKSAELIKKDRAAQEEQTVLDNLILKYKEYYAAQELAAKASMRGNLDLSNVYLDNARAIETEIRGLTKDKDALRETAEASHEVAIARQKAQDASVAMHSKTQTGETDELSKLINLYKEYYDALTRSSNEMSKGHVGMSDLYMEDARALEVEIKEITSKNDALRQEAEANHEVAIARQRAADASVSMHSKQSAAESKEEAAALKEYAKALTDYFNAIEKRTNATTGKNAISKDSEEYEKMSEEIERLKANVKSAGETLDKDGRKAAASMNNVQHAIANAAKASAAFRDEQRQSAGTKQIDDAEKAYKRLTTAVNMYNTAKRAKNEQQMGYWQSVVNEQVNALNGVLQEVDALHLDESVRNRILELIRQATTQQGALGAQTQATVSHTSDLGSAVNSIVTRYLSLLAVIRMIKSVLGDMIDYVHQYSDKMNEIRIITGKTSEEAEHLGETYRNLAESMSVSSLDMADAAIYFTRQGLGAAEIEKRLKSTTMYAKTANIEFERAAELITAVVNSMNLVEEEAEDGRAAAQRVADVFLKVGDNAATSGEEIGEAMQKAAASAGTFGVQFEWLAAYIATVSETTRQEARTIGTAFNTIIARLHQIKQQGYNSEDETKINDIAKALANVDIALMDQSGEWRDMTDILEDVAAKWSDMDDKTRSYIATTMAGVKQQNVFLALMNDMAKGVEGGSRAFELYKLAVDSAGTAMEKYAVYEDSVTAAQNKLTVAQEKFYAILQDDVLKNWYGFLTKIVTGITNATKASQGWNMIIPVLIGLLTTLGVAMARSAQQAMTLGASLKAFAMSHPITMGITAIATVFGILTATMSNSTDEAEEAAEKYSQASQNLEKSSQSLKEVISQQKQFNEMMEKYNEKGYLTNEEVSEYNGLLDELAKISPAAKKVVDDLRDGLAQQADVARELNDELERNVTIQKKIAKRDLINMLREWSPEEDTSEDINSEAYISNWKYLGDNNFVSMLNSVIDGTYQDTYGKRGLGPRMAAFLNGTFDEIYSEEEALDRESIAVLMRKAFEEEMEQYEAVKQKFEEVMQNGSSSALDRWKAAKDYTDYQARELPQELFETMLKNMTSGDYLGLDTTIQAGRKASEYELYLVDKFLGSDTARDDLRAKMVDEMETLIDQTVDVVGAEMSTSKQGILRGMLYSLIMGDDMELSDAEYYAMGKKIATFIEDASENGVDIAFKSMDVVKYAGKNLFGSNVFDVIFSEQLDNLVVNKPELVQKIADVYQELMELGLSSDDMVAIYGAANAESDNNIGNWANAFNYAIARFRDKAINAYKNENGESLIEQLLGDEFVNLDINALKLISDLSEIGVAYSDVEQAITSAGSNDEMIANLQKLFKSGEDNGDENALETLIKDLKEASKEIQSFDDTLKKIKSGEAVSFSDLLDLSQAHPEILAFINDTVHLQAALEELRNEKATNMIEQLQGWMLGDEEVMGRSKFRYYQNDNIQTLNDLLSDSTIGDDVKQDAQNYINEMTAMFLNASGEMETVGDEWLETFINSMFSDANMDLIHRKVIDAKDLVAAGWNAEDEGVATVYSQTYTAGNKDNGAGLAWNQDVVIAMTPILPDGTVLTEEALNQYMEELLEQSANIDELREADKNGKGLLIKVNAVTDDESFEEATQRLDAFMQVLHRIHEILFGSNEGSEESWLEKQVKAANETAELEWAKSNGYVEQMGAINRALETGGAEEAYNTWNHLTDSMRAAISDTYPEIASAMLEIERVINDENHTVEDLDKTWDHLSNTLKKSTKISTAKNFTSTYQAIQKLEKGTISATDAFDVFNKELDNITKAYDEVDAAQKKIAKGTSLTVNDVNDLAKALNMSAQEVIDDFPGAVAMLDELRQAGVDAFNDLNREATMKILGIGEADFSDLQKGMVAVQDEASATVQMLLALGQFKLEEREVEEGAEFPILNADGHGITTITATASGKYKYLVPTNTNPFGKGRTSGGGDSSSGKGGGGGGGDKNSNKNSMTEVERQLDRYSQRNAIQEYQQSYYGAQKSYYSQTGQLQGVIGYSQKEIDLLKEQSELLEGNIKWIEEYIDKKSAELAQLSITDEQYEEVADDLDKLQKAHQEYTNQLIENKTSIDELTNAIEEQRKKIREMEINLRQTILKAIEDREKRTENMLNAEIEMENTILDLITKRYEKERDQIIENTNLKIDSLNKEKEALDEQLRIRKEQAEAEDKQLKLRELEAKYQRIIADPTRMKEAKSIKSEIDDLRKEMAWDLAEEEVKAQQDSIDQQITSLEDYIEYVQNYYEDLFEHPQKLIAEMRDIMMMTDQEIIEWLKANDEEFDKSTENTQNKMITSWQETLDTMHDVIKTYWDEVEYIIEQGEDYIINFLKENSEDYRQAGKLQAEAYVDEWMEQLENLRKAYQDVATEAASTYSVIEKADSSSSGKSGGGGGGGGSGSGKNKHGYSFNYGGTDYAKDGYSSEILARTAGLALVESLAKKERDANGKANPSGGTVYEYQNNEINKRYLAAKNGLIAFGRGGIADFTGPAWVDGSVQDPERILTPYQNKLFETMVSVLEQVGRISISSMPYYGDMRTTGGNPVTVGDIIVNVENLDTDDDYEELAEKVSEVLMDRIGRTAAIGGLRIRSI